MTRASRELFTTDTATSAERRRITLSTASGAHAEIYFQGAHVTSWRPAGSDKDHLFVSERARYEPGVAIRGGVPICFPQFSDRGPLLKHGFARLQQWQLVSCAGLDEGRSQAVLALESNMSTLGLWPGHFSAVYTVTLTSDSLAMELKVTNTGTSAFSFTAALHTYLAVGDIGTSRLYGLRGNEYQNNGDDRIHTEKREAMLFRNAVDRVYRATPSFLTLKSDTQHTEIHAQGFDDSVVWNPWIEGCKQMDDMGREDYQRMLCVEAATVIHPVQLDPHKSWSGRQTLVAVADS